MKIISNPTQDKIIMAAKALKDGHLVAFPTETVYGLGADATNGKAVSQIYSVKGRPIDHPLIVHISSINQLDKWAIEIPEYAVKLAKEFWPGPMTLILKRSALAKDFITGGQDNVGVRVPEHPIALALLNKFDEVGGFGVAAPSANRFGAVSPTTSNAVGKELGNYLGQKDLILDGGNCLVGIESTIIDCVGYLPRVLRPGAITIDMIEKLTVTRVLDSVGTLIRTSGSFSSHYAPAAKIVLDQIPVVGQGYIALANFETPLGVIRLASPKTDSEFAQILYLALRSADEKKLSTIIVRQPTNSGIAVAIRDRLKRAVNRG